MPPKCITKITMVVKIQKSDNVEYSDTLKISNMMPFEYVIISKNEFDEPLTGEGTYGTWQKYNIILHEYNGLDDQTGETKKEVFNAGKELGFFVSAKSLTKHLKDLPLDVRVKVRQEQVEGKSYKLYVVERLDEVVDEATTSATTPGVPVDEKIKSFKDQGFDVSAIAPIVMKEYDVTEDFVKSRYEAL